MIKSFLKCNPIDFNGQLFGYLESEKRVYEISKPDDDGVLHGFFIGKFPEVQEDLSDLTITDCLPVERYE